MPLSPEERLKAERKLSVSGEPGRIHNLTAKEEQKLMQMWSHLLVATGQAPETIKPTKTSSSLVDNDKKKSGGWFGRGKKEEAVDESPEDVKNIRSAVKKALGPIKPKDLDKCLWRMFRGDNPDNLLLRFLRARKWVVQDAILMLAETLRWRLDMKVEDIMMGGEEQVREDKEEGVLLQFTSKKCYIWGHDLKGRPLVHVRPRFHDPKAQEEADVEKFTVMIIETCRLCLHDYVDTANVIFDLSDFSMGNMDYTAVKFIIKCFEAHYPESLGFILIHKAPWIFQGIWNIIKHWIDPVVAAKISFTRNHNDMSKFISDEYVPKELGGKREYEYEYIEPIAGENDSVKDTEAFEKIDQQRYKLGREFEEACLDWIQGKTDEERAAAQEKKNELAEKLRVSYWDFDKYYRRATVFDRNGLLKTFHSELRNKADQGAASDTPAAESEESKKAENAEKECDKTEKETEKTEKKADTELDETTKPDEKEATGSEA